MSITDELREWMKGSTLSSWTAEHLTAIADRIDAEHERQLEVLYRDMSDAEYVKLPVDADGECVHIGDVMEWARIEDDGLTIVREVSAVGNGVFFAWSDEQRRYAQYESRAYRHHHAPTVEDVFEGYGDTEDTVWFRDTRGNHHHPSQVLAWAEIPPLEVDA